MGTGFFHRIDYTEPDGPITQSLLLISNKHVFYEPQNRIASVTEPSTKPSKEIMISVNKRQKDGSPIFGDPKRVFFELHDNPRYVEHPDPSIDIACLNVSALINGSIPDLLYVRHTADNFLRPINYQKVMPGTDVLFVGYPGDRYDVRNNLPLVRKGSLASIPSMDFDGNKELVIDAGAFPGSSGSPVFVSFDGKYVLLGILTETLKTHGHEQDYLDLGIVLKQELVKELVDHATKRFIDLLSANKAVPESN